MNEDRKKRGLANSNLLIAMAITTLIIGSSNAMANQTASGSSYKVTEQMQIQTVTGVVVDANGEPIIGASVVIAVEVFSVVGRVCHHLVCLVVPISSVVVEWWVGIVVF